MAGEAIFEIGKRLKYVKENDLVHGEFMEWYESIGLTKDFVSKAIRIFDNLPNFETSRNIGLEVLYQIATLPPEHREVEHEVNGERKKPEDMTVRELREVKRSIDVNGIRDPIKCTTAFTVISGHQRLRIAKELGLTEVPVEIKDVDEWEAEYLLIAENVERRGQAEQDPIKKARIAQTLKEYWGVRDNGDRSDGQNVQRSMSDIGEALGTSAKGTQRLIKLNDLIPEIQTLVSSGKLGTTAAEQYAYITPENQRVLVEALGDRLGEKTVEESKAIREQAQEAKANSLANLKQNTDSANLHTREMTGEVADKLAKKAGMSKRNLYFLLAVYRNRPDLFELVFNGEYSIRRLIMYFIT